MQTFGDWLKYYNNLDVAPFLEALQKMKAFYTDLGVDIFKDAVSLPGVSQQFVLRGTLKPRRGYKPPDLYAPNKEAYGMLKAAVVGGPSLVFTRKHVASETKIRPHQYGEGAQLARRILGYDANSLYPSTMMKEMPCGPGVVTTYNHPELFAGLLPQLLYNREWFGFAEVDIEVPRELWTQRSRQRGAAAHARLPEEQRPQAFPRAAEAVGGHVGEEGLAIRSTAAMVPHERSQAYRGAPHHRLRAARDLHLVREGGG